ncbi:MAG: DNA primase, partial [Clostridia bacterium]|nr:DNA primase [Clostridia bacterium]
MNGGSDAGKPVWFDGRSINEYLFCEEFLRDFPMKSVNGTFFTVDGRVDSEELLRREIYERIRPFVPSGQAKKVNALFEVLRLQCLHPDFPVHADRIPVANGTLFLPLPDMEYFTEEKEYCRNRLPVEYNPEAAAPAVWLRFLSELLYEEDIPTLQEFMGYCLLPTTRGQKMLLM